MLHLERMDDVEAGGERRRAELRHSICQASDGVWNPVRCHYGLHRMNIEIRNQPRVCSLDATNLFKETSEFRKVISCPPDTGALLIP
jgi:hypothetical protein